jgi:hypothetical protein
MSNGEVCCILGVCCPPASEAQRTALEHMVAKHLGCKHDAPEAKAAADRVLAKFDAFRGVKEAIDAAPDA